MKHYGCPKGDHGVQPSRSRVHYYGCFPRAFSMVWGKRHCDAKYEDYVDVFTSVIGKRVEGFSFNQHRYADPEIAEIEEICIKLNRWTDDVQLGVVELTNRYRIPRLKHCYGIWPNFVAIVPGLEIKHHAIPVRKGRQVANIKVMRDKTPVMYVITEMDRDFISWRT